MTYLGGLNCGEHRYRRDCPDCVQIRIWAATEGRRPGIQPPPRTAADEAHAAAVMERLLQREITVSRVARWCERRVAEG